MTLPSFPFFLTRDAFRDSGSITRGAPEITHLHRIPTATRKKENGKGGTKERKENETRRKKNIQVVMVVVVVVIWM